MSTLAVATLHQALRKSFATLESNQKVWKSVLAECSPLMVSLGNLAEQSRALSNVQISNTPLRGFPDLEERLRFKLLEATDIVLGKLNEKMSSLQSARDAISNQVASILHLYEQNAHSLDLLAVTERSTTTPSVADMLEWLQDAERHYRQQYPFLSSVLDVYVIFWYFCPLNSCVQIPEEENSASNTESR
uniref:AFG2 interacting ribosome maturation factor n=1 Tax=Neolamprologus brichardi TaxID=32507 RepID=A0A3Q4MRD1_NEOBR